MKIRTCFVSNSSTSSFLIYGICTEDEAIKDRIEELEWKEMRKLQLQSYNPESYGQVYFGCSLFNIKDDQTMGQFKEEIRKLIKGLLPDVRDEDFNIFQETWYDG